MSLILSSNQSFTSVEGMNLTPLYSNWQFRSTSNVGLPDIIFQKNAPQSTVVYYQIKPKQGYEMWINQGYTNLKIKCDIVFGPNVDVLFYPTCPLIPEMNYTAHSGNTWYELTLGISPKLTNPLGLNTITLKFRIEGRKNGLPFILSTYDFPINIHVLDEGYYFSPMDFTFYKSNNVTPTQTLILDGDNFNVKIPYGLKITSNTATINPLPNGGYSSSGLGFTQYALGFDTNIDAVLGSNTSIQLPIIVSYANVNYIIPVTIQQVGDVYPNQLEFFIASGLIDNDFLDVILNKQGSVVFQAPSYLYVSLIDIENQRRLRVYVLDAENLGSGIYQDNINLSIGSSNYVIPVKISVSNAFDIGIENEMVNFTKSMNDLNFQSNNENTFIELVLSQSNVPSIFTYRIPFTNGACNKNIGLVLDRTLQFENNELEYVSTLPFFNLNIKEKKSDTTVLEFSKDNINYVKGYKPKVINNMAILQHNTQSRFSEKSFALVSIMSVSGVYGYSIKKNGISVFSSENLLGHLVTLKLDFSLYDVVAGDLIEFVLHTDQEDLIKSFIIFPETETSFEIVYEDSFGLKSALNFTGNTKKILREINNVFETYQHRTYFHQKKLKISDEKRLTLNTGFLLKSQILEVDELVDSKKAFLYINGVKKLELVPVMDKITTLDSDEFTISYSVEFIINPEQYAQDHNI